MSDTLDLQWRAMRDEDRNYILSSWLRSYAEASEFTSVRRDVFYELYEPLVKDLVDRSTVAVCWTEDLPDTIIGYVVVEGADVIHYVSTRRRFRRCGVGRWMLREFAEQPVTYTHYPTFAAIRLISAAWKFDPMRRFEKKAA